MITIEYDKQADAAYIYLIKEEERTAGWVKKTYPCDPSEVNGMINLDFDNNGCLGGIEVMDASKKLSQEILDQAETIG
ncbi:DUF2283 domain-containing protein [Patescibacteria group bacterium]|nr:DUF2283 domain-containing protein [Patescibacteria group bacterium]